MTSAQKVIKYVAIAFAIFLIVSIFSFILAGVGSLVGLFGSNNSGETRIIEIENNEFTNLDIDLSASSINIKKSDKFYLETNNDDVTVLEGDTLRIKDKKRKLNFRNNLNVTLYVSSDIFDKVNIDSGAGSLKIESLVSDNLVLDLGAGEVEIDNLVVNKKASINGGAGSIKVSNGIINNLDLEIGIGEVKLNAELQGNNKIDSGIGSLNITLFGNKSDYKLESSKGLGNIKIDSNNVKDGEVIGNGSNFIKLNGGIGDINVNFK